MGRQRKGDHQLPPRVDRLPSGSYRWRPLVGKGRVIAKKDASMAEIWRVWEKLNQVDSKNSLAYLAEQYYKSRAFLSLKPRTQKDYRNECSKRPLIAFEGWDAREITAGDIGQYMSLRGEKHLRRANLELQWFKNVFGHAVFLGLLEAPHAALDIRPLRLTREEKEEKLEEERYVTDREYLRLLSVAYPAVQVAMELSYCMGIRQGDVLKLNFKDIESQIYIREGKTDQAYLKEVSPRLRKALEAAKKLPGHPFEGWVVRNTKGGRYTSSGFQTMFKKSKARLERHRDGLFTFHEIRHKAITDFKDGKKQTFSMHSDARMLNVYDHSLEVSPSH